MGSLEQVTIRLDFGRPVGERVDHALKKMKRPCGRPVRVLLQFSHKFAKGFFFPEYVEPIPAFRKGTV
ncbi:MAG: hypothetical protein NVS9B12_01010 [Vulcanimicrobiaceae bacterium]